MMIGKNSVSGRELVDVIEKIEVLREKKQQISDDEKVLMAGAKAAGFIPSFINLAIKARAAKPHDFQDYEQTRDLYLHAIGMAETPPLFRQLEAIGTDALALEALIEKFSAFVPRGGEFTLQLEPKAAPVRIWRDADGTVHHETVTKAPRDARPSSSRSSTRETPEPPAGTPDQAEQMGFEAFGANTPITLNPFPFGDPRRPRWDKGWRRGSGNDGMGPGDDD